MASEPDRLDASSLARATRRLAAADAGLGRIVDARGLPPLWARPGGFRTLARIILEQQVSLASAATLFRRLDRNIDGGMRAAAIADVGVAGLRRLGVTRQKARYLASLAEQVTSGVLDLRAVSRLDDQAAEARLIALPGIGPWSAAIYLLMALRRPDVWPRGDLALHVALARLRGQSKLPSSEAAARYAERWRPWRSVAARILWHDYLAMRSTRLPIVT